MGMMTYIAKVKNYIFESISGGKSCRTTSDFGDGVSRKNYHFGPAGDDSAPLPGDEAVCIVNARRQPGYCVGYYDQRNQGEAQGGEKRIYSRSVSGTLKAFLWLRNDGSITIDNLNSSIEISASGQIKINSASTVIIDSSGDIDLNGVKISSAGAMTVPSSLILAGKQIAGHTHASPAGPTGPNL